VAAGLNVAATAVFVALFAFVTAIGFLAAPHALKLPVALAPLAVQLAWAGYVIRLARSGKIGKW